jgi:hypothetical protein
MNGGTKKLQSSDLKNIRFEDSTESLCHNFGEQYQETVKKKEEG